MTPKPSPHAADPAVAAGYWFSLKRSGEMSAQEAREFAVWRERDAAHAEAFTEIERMWSATDALRGDPEMLAVRDAARRAHPQPSRILVIGAVAASIAIASLSVWTAYSSGVFAEFTTPVEQQVFSTGVGERTTVDLPDGSTVTLDTDTIVHTRESGSKRLVELKKGQAYFKVAKDRSRPFIVSASGKTVTATGTAFYVRVQPEKFQVTLVEGKVRVESPRKAGKPRQSADMLAGWRLTARGGRDWKLSQVDLAKETSWLYGRLTFNNQPMDEVAAELNRYSEKKIVVRDPAITMVPVVGVVDTGDVDGFVKLVKDMKLARVASDNDKSVELVAP